MASRKAQAMDIEAIRYIKEETTRRGRDRAWLAKSSGISYQTLRGWWDTENVAISIGDLDLMFRALGVDAAEALYAIRQRVIAGQEAQGDIPYI